MSEGLLTRYMEAGFPHLRQISGLPEWLAPDVPEVARTLGDDGMLKLAEPLVEADRVKAMLVRAPGADSLPIEVWQEGIGRWQALRQVLPVAMALLRACEKIDALERRGALVVDLASLARDLAVISWAPLAPDGSEILDRLASVLGGRTTDPAGLLELYTAAVVKGDTGTLAGVASCIMESPAWTAWSDGLLAAGAAFPFTPRVVGVSPALTGALKQVLGSMMTEALNADRSGDHPN
ncbi:MAG: hypothetical protein Q8O76_07550 [Chloroflexota bacterium]|nr:hypothetical protein [Chloroflexota bacterium]